MQPIEALRQLGIPANETITGRVIVPEIPSVDIADQNTLVPLILKINKKLKEHGLLDKWRAQKGGTGETRWILIVGQ